MYAKTLLADNMQAYSRARGWHWGSTTMGLSQPSGSWKTRARRYRVEKRTSGSSLALRGVMGTLTSSASAWRAAIDSGTLWGGGGGGGRANSFERSRFCGSSQDQSCGKKLYVEVVCPGCRYMYGPCDGGRHEHGGGRGRPFEGGRDGFGGGGREADDEDTDMIDAAVLVSPLTPTDGVPASTARVTQAIKLITPMRPIQGLPAHLCSGHMVDPDEQDEVDQYDHLVLTPLTTNPRPSAYDPDEQGEVDQYDHLVLTPLSATPRPGILTDSDTLQQSSDVTWMELDSPDADMMES